MSDKIDMEKAAATAGRSNGLNKEAKDKMMFDKTPGKEASDKNINKNKLGNMSEDLFGK